jgi:hypothetical protein
MLEGSCFGAGEGMRWVGQIDKRRLPKENGEDLRDLKLDKFILCF